MGGYFSACGARAMKSAMSYPFAKSRRIAPASPWRAAVVGGLIGFLAALIIFAPARWMAAGLFEATNGRIQLVNVRGTVWTGSGRVLLTGGSDSRDKAVLPGTFKWELRPAWAGLKLQINAACCTPAPLQTRLTLGWNAIELTVEDGFSQWPANLMVGLGTPWNTIQADANLQLTTANLVFKSLEGRLVVAGAAQLKALDVSSRLSEVKPLGSYQLLFNGGPMPAVELITLSGAFKLSGKGSWIGPRLRFNGTASVDPDMVATFANLLNIIGRRQGVQSIITIG